MIDHQYKIALISGFIGAVLAFVFTRLGDFLNRIKKRNVQNLNSLVKLEHLMNEYGMVVNDNQQNMETIASAISTPNAIPLNRLNTITVDQSVKIGLLDIKLVNRVMEIEYDLRRFNDDAKMINYQLNQFQKALLAGTIPPPQYKVFTEGVIGEAAMYQAFMDNFLDKLAGLSAYIQLREQVDSTWTIKLLNFLVRLGKTEPAAEEVKKRKKKVLEDINKSRKDSIKEKQRILSKVKK